MTAEAKGRDLFIVDNSVSGWTGLRYLEVIDAPPARTGRRRTRAA